MSATSQSLGGRSAAPAACAAALLLALCGVSGLAAVATLLSGVPGYGGGDPSSADIPSHYLALYQSAASRFELGADGWSVLAAVGKVECDHGRSPAEGCGRGEHNAAGARGPAQFLPATWSRYGVDGDGDGDRDVWDPADAIYGMAHYLRASGAPKDWRAALFAYNHAGWYVDKVLAQAADYRRESSAAASNSPTALVPRQGGAWLVALPGSPGQRCDARIVPDVRALVAAFGIQVTSCYSESPQHKVRGEHPLGLAIDAVPEDGDWDRTMALARTFGWTESCAATGCPGRGPFRVILYNGYPSHGDPQHSPIPHIHVSWEHAPAQPFKPAAWVRTLTNARSSTTTPPAAGGRR